MYLFLIYNDPEQERLCGWYKFSKIKDIIKFTNNLFRYSDVAGKTSVYKTYKAHFKFVRVTPLERYNYFSVKKNMLYY
tara:strand:- start:1196 stop:1429 length:234 start_codon:yes stop_codon:yes gene_type:complete